MKTRTVAALLSALTALAPAALAQSTSFTYQGRLERPSGPVTGTANLIFRFYDASAGGSEVAPQLTTIAAVTNGIFTTEVNPAIALFERNADVWVEIQVLVLGDPAWTSLGRQKFTPAPFSSATRGLFVTGSGATARAGVGAVSTAKFTVDENTNATASIAVDSGLTAAATSEVDFRDRGTSAWRIGKTNTNDLFIDRTFVSRMFTITTAGHASLGFNAIVNPGGYSRTFVIDGNNSFNTPNLGSAALTLNQSDAGSQWQIGVRDSSSLRFEHSGNGASVVSVPVLQIRGGSDIAEPYNIAPAADVEPTPGMVVVIDPNRVGSLRVAASAYDIAVAGVISGANGVHTGLTLTQEGSVADGALPVANVGRVWCYVDADANGPVRAGDLLTTSPTPGHAMRAAADKANGAVLGKAMSPLPAGKGLVLVLVGLQ